MPTCLPVFQADGTVARRLGSGVPRPGWPAAHHVAGTRENPLFDAFIEAGRQAGYPVTQDYNGHQQEGFGPFEATIWKGRRWSAANAYLKPAMAGGNVHVVRGFARRVVMEGKRAVGVEVDTRGKGARVIRAGREVILAASSINTPKLLMLSGIGPAAHLREHGVEVLADRPGVGANLQDHLEVYMQFSASQPITLYKYWNLWGKAWVGAQWLFGWERAGSVEPVRSLRLHPLESGDGIPRHPVPLPAHRSAL